MITLIDYITASGKYPERAISLECTASVRLNAKDLLIKVNALLSYLGVTAKVASGFRPSKVNARIKNAAAKSKHMRGLAIDIEDVDGEIARRIQVNVEVLTEFGLYMEDPYFTRSWVHLQSEPPRSGNRIFKP